MDMHLLAVFGQFWNMKGSSWGHYKIFQYLSMRFGSTSKYLGLSPHPQNQVEPDQGHLCSVASVSCPVISNAMSDASLLLHTISQQAGMSNVPCALHGCDHSVADSCQVHRRIYGTAGF